MHDLYRHYDKNGILLYVGISNNAVKRLSGHKTAKWYNYIETVKIEKFETELDALEAEKIAIATEAPLYNKSRPPPSDKSAIVKEPYEFSHFEKERKAEIFAYIMRTYTPQKGGRKVAVIACPYCSKEHYHGATEGFREPHCNERFKKGKPQYYIKYRPYDREVFENLLREYDAK